jgi:hypothetical protein
MVKLKFSKDNCTKINIIYFLLLNIIFIVDKTYAAEQAIINNMVVKEPTNVIVPSLLNAIPNPKTEPKNPTTVNNNTIPNSNIHEVQKTTSGDLQPPSQDNNLLSNKSDSTPSIILPTVSANQQAPISDNIPNTLPTKIDNAPPNITDNPITTNNTIGPNTDNSVEPNLTNVPTDISDASKKPATNNLNLWFGSMMFDDQSFSSIKNAIKEYELNKELLEKAISEGTPIPANIPIKPGQAIAVPLPTISPSFTLNSIIYKGLDNWVIWINKKKFTFNSTEGIIPDVNIENVSHNEVEIVFRTSFIDHLSPNWTKMVIKNKQGEYISKDRGIKISSDKKTIKFKLRPNQTFVFYDMDIAEGFVSDRAVAVNSTSQVPGAVNPATLQTPGAVNPTMSQGAGNANPPTIKN